MGHTPQAFMIYKEELKKAKLEQDRLRQEYEQHIDKLNDELSVLKERIEAQEDMFKRITTYVSQLEGQVDKFKEKVHTDLLKNRNGYH